MFADEDVAITIGADIVSGLIAGFVSDGLRRAFRNLAGEVSRRPKLTNILTEKGRAAATTSPDYDRAMDELRRVIAHDTEPVAEFFRELNKTAIPDALVQRALAAAPTEPLFAAFNKIYEACKPLTVREQSTLRRIVNCYCVTHTGQRTRSCPLGRDSGAAYRTF